MSEKANILLVGCGGIGTIAALNLETGGRAVVTAVLRSNYEAVKDKGFHIQSVNHGIVNGYKPSTIRNTIPNVIEENLKSFKYLICATKNVADVPPSLVDIVRPAVTPGYTIIYLLQNGLNIERPFITAFPENIVLSGVSFCGAHQLEPGEIEHKDSDRCEIGAFRNPNLDPNVEDREAQDFCAIYAAGGKCTVTFKSDVGFSRWRKLLYNACYNSLCAITDLDTGRMQLADGAIELLVRPAMEEIRAAANACGHELTVDMVDSMIKADAIDMYILPSMQVDARKNQFTEYENIVGEAVREGTANGVSMPILTVIYGLLKTLQWKVKEKRGLVEIPRPADKAQV